LSCPDAVQRPLERSGEDGVKCETTFIVRQYGESPWGVCSGLLLQENFRGVCSVGVQVLYTRFFLRSCMGRKCKNQNYDFEILFYINPFEETSA
jgi:hypothetical protein